MATPTIEDIGKMTATAIAALDVNALGAEERAAADKRLDELLAATRADRQAKARAAKLAEERRANAFEVDVLPGLIDKHGDLDADIAIVEGSAGIVVIRRPNAMFYRRFAIRVTEKLTEEEVLKLVHHVAVYPDRQGLDAIFERAPGMLFACCNKALDLGRAQREHVEGK